MFKMFDFSVEQVTFIKSVMLLIPSYTPDGKTAVQVQTMITAAGTVRSNYVTAKADLNVTQGTRHTGYDALHAASVAFLAQASSAFRNETSLVSLLQNIPTADKSLGQIITRGKDTDAAWTKLSNFATPPVPFTIMLGTTTTTQADFQTLITNATTANTNIPTDNSDFQIAEGALHKMNATLDDFVTAALEQGRSQFPDPNTPERELINSIPTKPAYQKPDVAHILTLTSPAAEEITMTYDAVRGTSFDIFHLAPGSTVYVEVATQTIEKTFSMNSLIPGTHTFRVNGHNSRGNGLPATASILVA